MTFTLDRTLQDIQRRDHTDTIIIIDTTTNNAKRDNLTNATSRRTHELQRKIISTYQQKYGQTDRLIFMETIPSLNFDIHPYNRAAFSICREMGVSFCPTLVGEPHLFKDGIHILHRHRPLSVDSVAAAIVGTEPQMLLHLPRPPHGPYGPWQSPWGSQNRPDPTNRWPPSGAIGTVARYPPIFGHSRPQRK